ncbi:MAG: hypothetical protein EA384_13335 [Spirochaetaceae bacterium]|nr:MAG: hypothetical protein EA384_13335 [Spirochaetaceae bacterium]
MKRPLSLALVFSLQSPCDRQARSAEVVAELLRWPEIASGGVTWSFAASLLETPTPAVTQLTEALGGRTRSGRDSLALCGYSGAPHGALLEEELKRELNWTLRNNWGSGIRSRLGVDAPGFFHASADLARLSTLKRYGDKFPFVIAGFDASAASPLSELILYDNSRRYRLAAADWNRLIGPHADRPGSPARTIRRLTRAFLRSARSAPAAALLVQVGTPVDQWSLPLLRQLLRVLANRARLELVPLDARLAGLCAIDHRAAPVIELVNNAPVSPALMRAVRLASDRRGGRQTADQTRTILQLLSGCPAKGDQDSGGVGSGASPAPADEGREYIASMIGSATLSDKNIAVWFEEGALRRVESDEQSLLANRPALGWVEFAHRRQPMIVESAFSFESRQAHGLTTYALLTDQDLELPGNLQMDVLLVENFNWLVLDIRFATPVASQGVVVRRLSPLEIPLCDCSMGQWVEIESLYPDGSHGSAYVEPGRKVTTATIWGSVFRIRWQDRVLSVGYPSLAGQSVAPLTVELAPSGKRRCRIGLHVAGCYVDPDLARSGEERVTVCIAAGEPNAAAILKPPDRLRDALLKPVAHSASG